VGTQAVQPSVLNPHPTPEILEQRHRLHFRLNCRVCGGLKHTVPQLRQIVREKEQLESKVVENRHREVGGDLYSFRDKPTDLLLAASGEILYSLLMHLQFYIS